MGEPSEEVVRTVKGSAPHLQCRLDRQKFVTGMVRREPEKPEANILTFIIGHSNCIKALHMVANPRLIVHIGPAQVGSTSIREGLLSSLSEKGYINYNANWRPMLKEIFYNQHLFGDSGTNDHAIKLNLGASSLTPKTTIVSDEGIIHPSDWDPGIWEESHEIAKKILPQDSEILICLREPKDYLISCYRMLLSLGTVKLEIND